MFTTIWYLLGGQKGHVMQIVREIYHEYVCNTTTSTSKPTAGADLLTVLGILSCARVGGAIAGGTVIRLSRGTSKVYDISYEYLQQSVTNSQQH